MHLRKVLKVFGVLIVSAIILSVSTSCSFNISKESPDLYGPAPVISNWEDEDLDEEIVYDDILNDEGFREKYK